MYLPFKFNYFGSSLFRNVVDWLTQILYFMSYLANNNAVLKEKCFSCILVFYYRAVFRSKSRKLS